MTTDLMVRLAFWSLAAMTALSCSDEGEGLRPDASDGVQIDVDDAETDGGVRTDATFRDASDGDLDSSTSDAEVARSDPPTIEPTSGTYPYRTPIVLGTRHPGAEIRYTLDGSAPLPSSPVYERSILLSRDLLFRDLSSQNSGGALVVRAIALERDHQPSLEVYGEYRVEPAMLIHFKKPAGWESAHLYFWDSSPGKLKTIWPGVEMSPEEDGWYYFSLKDQVAASFLFNGGDRPQTEDIFWAEREGWFDGWERWAISPERVKAYETCCMFPGGRSKALVMSFDDGSEQDARLIGLFDRYGIKGTFHLNSGRLGGRDIAAIYRGHEVSAHSVSHPYLYDSTKEQLEAEVLADRRSLEELVGYPVRGMSYPFGSYNTLLLKLMEEWGLIYGRAAVSTKDFGLPYDLLRWRGTCHHSEASGFIDEFLARSESVMSLFFIWGHSWEFDKNEPNNGWPYIEDVSRRLSGRSDVWYATVVEVADYLRALRRLRFSSEPARVENLSTLSVWVRTTHGSVVELKAGETTDL